MAISPFAVATQGLLGFGTAMVAAQGLLPVGFDAPKPSGGGTAGQRARAWRRTQDFNQNLLSVVAVIVASGILEGSDP